MDAINALTPAFQKLSEIFCVSVDAIQANALPYILQYGRYHAFEEALSNLFATALILCIILFIVALFWFLGEVCEYIDEKYHAKIYKTVGIVCVVILAVSTAVPLILFYIEPEVYSIQVVIQLLK